MLRHVRAAIQSLFPTLYRGRPGQLDGGLVFCPIFDRWIPYLELHGPISGNRTFYDELDPDDPMLPLPQAQDLLDAVRGSGRTGESGIREVVRICQFCEAYCLGEEDGPTHVPPPEEIDHDALRARLR